MYLCKVEVRDSNIEGKGVFITESTVKGSVVWKFNSGSDKSMTQVEYTALNEESKREMEKVGYLSPSSGLWIYPSEDDVARYTNHSTLHNNLSVKFDSEISPEVFFIANRNIGEGEELIVNYLEFDEFIKNTKPDWI